MTTTFSRTVGWLTVCSAVLAIVAGSMLVQPATISAQTEPVPVPAGDVIVSDDFSDPGSGWFVGSSQFSRCAYDNGEYVVASLPPSGGTVFCSLREVARDFVVEVDARSPSGGEGDGVSLVTRAKFLGPGQFRGVVRLAVIPATGRVRLAVATFEGQNVNVQLLAEALDHPAVNRGTATNRLGLKVIGSTFVGYVNGQEVVRGESDAHPDGNIALEVIGPRGGTTEARFDNFVVSQVGAE